MLTSNKVLVLGKDSQPPRAAQLADEKAQWKAQWVNESVAPLGFSSVLRAPCI